MAEFVAQNLFRDLEYQFKYLESTIEDLKTNNTKENFIKAKENMSDIENLLYAKIPGTLNKINDNKIEKKEDFQEELEFAEETYAELIQKFKDIQTNN